MKFKKARKIYRVLFPMQNSKQESFENNLYGNKKIKNFSKKNDLYEVTLFNNSKLIMRNCDHSDYSVFKQIFNFEEYKLILSLLNYNAVLNNDEKIFIDAGANVGYTTTYFSQLFNFDKIISIEPSVDNLKILQQNIKHLTNFDKITVYQNALTNVENKNFTLDNSFRDCKDWSISTVESANGEVKGITLNEIIISNNLQHISLLKIDIEGAERSIFNKESNLDFLKIVKVLAIEIHDEYNIREEINNLLIESHFIIFESGELTVGINEKYI